ncbi:MAG: GNAT family N-acetyltransferase [Anaerolineaceae bacterium]|nr:GNAT family N-acetyltransferase [Anaerolineaceae bacterium]
MELETQRLILRRWKDEDAASLYEYARDPETGPIAGWPPHQSVEESLKVIRNVLSGPEAYALCLKEDGKAIGAIELKLKDNDRNDLAEQDDECELGFWIGKPFRGRGLMPEAAEELLRHAFEDLGMQKVWCGYYDGNTKSKRVQEKCGFRYQWTTPDVDVPLMHEKRTGHVNLLTKTDWRVRKSLTRFDNHDARIRYYELALERSLEDIPEQALPDGYSFATYSPGDMDTWIEIEKSAKEFRTDEEGLAAWQKYFGSHEAILPDRMFFVVNTKGKKAAAATAFFDIRKEDDGINGMLHWVSVRRDEQGKGLSKPLILRVLQRMRELGYRRAAISTQTTTWLAVKVYLDLGFLPISQNAERNRKGWQIIKTLTGHPALSEFDAIEEDEILETNNKLQS